MLMLANSATSFPSAGSPGSSPDTPIMLTSKADEDNLTTGEWVVDARGIPWEWGIPVPVVVTKEDYDSVPLGFPYFWEDHLYSNGTSPWQGATPSNKIAQAAPTPNNNQLDQWANLLGPVVLILLLGTVVVIFAAAIIGRLFDGERKPESKSAKPKKAGHLYHDYEQFKLATQVWIRDGQLFEQNETRRLASLKG